MGMVIRAVSISYLIYVDDILLPRQIANQTTYPLCRKEEIDGATWLRNLEGLLRTAQRQKDVKIGDIILKMQIFTNHNKASF